MLKRPFVSMFHSLKTKGTRYYWVPSKFEELNNLSFIKHKYNIPNEVIELIENQEKYITNITQQLINLQTNQKKVIEKIYDNLQHKN